MLVKHKESVRGNSTLEETLGKSLPPTPQPQPPPPPPAVTHNFSSLMFPGAGLCGGSESPDIPMSKTGSGRNTGKQPELSWECWKYFNSFI